MEKVAFIPFHECWEWTASLDGRGYGQININKKMHRAHRLSWQIANGRELTKNELVCHSCDNPTCVNPKHLWIGTQKDNMSDCARKNRVYRPKPYLTTHCKRGHLFDEKSTYIAPKKGDRRCRICAVRHQRDYRRAKGALFLK
jgi:hypothetical protein